MTILSLDHLVLTVANIPATCEFYARALNFEVDESNGHWALKFGNPTAQKINLHQIDHTFEPKAAHPTPGSGDLCFITTDTPEAIIEHLKSLEIAIEEGPIARYGALGPMTSVYFRDPDGNLLEVSKYI
jgi:catechol 2,3-dioxygenase-like lactoylglutathione lyase family enzyme